MKILLLGGTGNISYNVLREALANKYQATIVTRGSLHSSRRNIDDPNLTKISGDVNQVPLHQLIGNQDYDIVIDFICYTKEQAQQRIAFFSSMVKKYFFISTTAFYSKDPRHLPYTELSPVECLDWEYSLGKCQAEQEFISAYEKQAFPVVILRLAHTYDTALPVAVGPADWTIPKRIINERPIVVHGDGSCIWTLLHAKDAAMAIIQLTISNISLGDIINIVSDRRYTWLYITGLLYLVLGKREKIVFLPTVVINRISPYLGNGILGHKMWNDFYDNKKLKSILPNWEPSLSLTDGLLESTNWYMAEAYRQHTSTELDLLIDQMVYASKRSDITGSLYE